MHLRAEAERQTLCALCALRRLWVDAVVDVSHRDAERRLLQERPQERGRVRPSGEGDILQVDILADDDGSKAYTGKETLQDHFRTLPKPPPSMGERLKQWFGGLFE